MSADSETDSGDDAPVGGERTVRPPTLETTLVRYERRRDRVTVHPDDPTPEERLTAWVSVDRGVVCDLAAMR